MPDSLTNTMPNISSEIQAVKSMSVDELINKLISSCVTFAINLTIALIVFYAGKFIIKRIYRFVDTVMARRHVDKSLATFVLSMIKIVLYFILIVIVIGILGIETSSFIALFASAGVAIGMALSGTLQNFAGGVLILLLKPYKVGDYIETQGFAGYVTEIQIFHTIINTYDNKSIIIPNGGLSTGSINNWSREDYRRVDWTVSISYGDDVEMARKTLLDIFRSDDRIVKQYIEDDRKRYLQADLAKQISEQTENEGDDTSAAHRGWLYRLFHRRRVKMARRLEALRDSTVMNTVLAADPVDRGPSVKVSLLNSSSVDLVARVWTRSELYWAVYYDMNERIYNELPKHGITFPFPQMDVHLPEVVSAPGSTPGTSFGGASNGTSN